MYMAPEILEEKDITFKVDSYSMGMTLWTILSGSLPIGYHAIA